MLSDARIVIGHHLEICWLLFELASVNVWPVARVQDSPSLAHLYQLPRSFLSHFTRCTVGTFKTRQSVAEFPTCMCIGRFCDTAHELVTVMRPLQSSKNKMFPSW